VTISRELDVAASAFGHTARFLAMGSPCEVLLETRHGKDARRLGDIASREAWRIEAHLSRYLDGNVVARINSARGEPVIVDDETRRLIDFGATLHAMSDGRFDITSGVLRRAWRFDGSDNVPTTERVEAVRKLVGWHRVRWEPPQLTIPAGMEIDFGGIGKEYAVDRVAALLQEASAVPALVNFGGDLAATRPPAARDHWLVGVEALERAGEAGDRRIRLVSGALATSGDARRYLLKDGVRYSHILDPKTGWPVTDAPRAVTVLADTCVQAGMLATLAMLEGPSAESFLEREAVKFWCVRE